MIVYPCAKINLGLNVVSKRQDGYHSLETVFYPIPLFDVLEIEPSQASTSLVLKGQTIEGNPNDNLVMKAYDAMRQRRPIPNVRITLDKRIPSQAGMGGGSSDCAYTITSLNEMFSLGMSIGEMRDVAASLGADCPFFIAPEPSFAEGIGEKLTPLPFSLQGYWIAVVKPPVSVSTRDAFSKIVPKRPSERCDSIVLGDISEWKNRLKNDFEDSVFGIYPELSAVKQRLYNMGALYSCMSGSGSAVVGIFSEEPPMIDDVEYYKMPL
ncbi:MAG: 4-(cytidine 5'-diphospho)-2-C-methyl-D-erythritol kinase [Prevotella sp.]|uniref:4-(cytidine 5'-diphospho)-2-C-methyl-D-erythritol kinase n=1 Tax=Prevotella sp. TaxID=59823 RepID=UPI002A2509BE|nr:4-(cytidine 5'-diphospho)-2-C-methyl-D-erythritol kinase [Prevotella sp.]MDD7318066.1 4-(cytidine 5'-diphospho)-2-C-methyl-D-erythritol kinase [Prevotellaceae bacterium]MDY4021045.1 4-(cytidine 5'-diphospho)-2-C-methyl-D-erythritol kinase [Prevotella sp.]